MIKNESIQLQIKKAYAESAIKDILCNQQLAENTITEILSKACPCHGIHANIELKKNEELVVVTCCDEMQSLIHTIIYYNTRISN